MKRMWSYVKENAKVYSLIITILLLVNSAQLILPIIIRSAINDIESIKNYQVLYKDAFYMLIIAITIVGGRFIYNSLLRKAALNFEDSMRTSLFSKYMSLPDSFFHSHEIGDLMARVNNDTRLLRHFLVMGFIAGIDILFLGTASLFMMVYLNLNLTLIVLIPLALLIFLAKFVSPKFHSLFKKTQVTFGEITTRIREALVGMRVIRTFVREDFYSGLFDNICTSYVKINMNLAKVMGLFDPSITFLVRTATVLIYLFGGKLVIDKMLTLGSLVAFSQYIQTLSWPMMAFGFVINQYQRASISIKRIEEIFNSPSADSMQKIKINPKLDGKTLKITNLSFSYSSAKTRKILEDININLNNGEILGLTGPTGSGKTTLLSTILRVWEPPENTIFIDNYDITTLDLNAYRTKFTYVPQEVFLFSATIRENLSFGNINATEEEIIKAAKIASVWDEIMKFDKGLDTLVGERGVTLSGGQKQRVAIARAVLTNKPILLFDDPLSSVDSETEQNIISGLKFFLKETNKMCILISHRVTALSWANNIGVIKHGRMIEYGNHSNLIDKQGYYYHLYRQQYLEGVKVLNDIS